MVLKAFILTYVFIGALVFIYKLFKEKYPVSFWVFGFVMTVAGWPLALYYEIERGDNSG